MTIDVDERGTEAAAATVTHYRVTASLKEEKEPEPIVFRADHPFIYFLRDSETGAVLFAGRLVTPTPGAR